jgi:hypothetical protein
MGFCETIAFRKSSRLDEILCQIHESHMVESRLDNKGILQLKAKPNK